MKKYNSRFIFYLTKNLKKEVKKRAKELDLSMADYLRTLIKYDIKVNKICENDFKNNIDELELDKLNCKLSGFYKGL